MSALSNAIRHFKRTHPHTGNIAQTIVVLTAIAAIPLIYAGLLTWSNIDPIGHLDRVPAAIVNQDQGNDDPELALGDELTKKLVNSTQSNNLEWTEMSSSRAQEALRNGDVYAVLSIPAGFSSDAASIGGDDPSQARRAQLTITTNDSTNMISGNLAQSIATQVTDTLDEQVSDQYLRNIYAGFNEVHENLGDAANGAEELTNGTASAKEGSADLVVGLNNLKDGSITLSDGAKQLASGTNDLATATAQTEAGAHKLATGADQLDGATGRLASGASRVDSGAKQLKNGIDSASQGSQDLTSGLSQLEEKTSSMPQSIAALKDGTSQLKSGSQNLATGASALSDGASQLSTGASSLADGADQAVRGAQQLQKGTSTLADKSSKITEGAQHLAEGINTLTENTSGLSTGAQEVDSGIDRLIANWDTLPDEQKKAVLTKIAAGSQQVADGAEKLNSGTSELNRNTGVLVAGVTKADEAIQQLNHGATELVGNENGGLTKLANGTRSLSKGASDTAAGAQELSSGASRLSEGASTLDDGVGQLQSRTEQLTNALSQASAGSSRLSDGLGELSTGASSLTTGTTQLASGSNELADGTNELATGTKRLAGGASQLNTGAQQLNTGAQDLANGTTRLVEGTDQAAEGAAQLDDGLGELNTGTAQLRDGLQDGANEIPTYSDSETDTLVATASRPIDLNKQRLNEVPSYGYGLGPYFMALSLWIGALGFFLMFAALNARLFGSEMSALGVAIASYGPGALMAIIQAILMVCIVHFFVGIEFSRLGQAFIVAVLASLTFMLINQALVALLGPPGRFLSLIFTVLQLAAAGAIYPIETTPQFFQTIHPYLPMTEIVNAFRAAIAGGSINLGRVTVVLGCYFLLALVLLILAVIVRRRLESVNGQQARTIGEPTVVLAGSSR